MGEGSRTQDVMAFTATEWLVERFFEPGKEHLGRLRFGVGKGIDKKLYFGFVKSRDAFSASEVEK